MDLLGRRRHGRLGHQVFGGTLPSVYTVWKGITGSRIRVLGAWVNKLWTNDGLVWTGPAKKDVEASRSVGRRLTGWE